MSDYCKIHGHDLVDGYGEHEGSNVCQNCAMVVPSEIAFNKWRPSSNEQLYHIEPSYMLEWLPNSSEQFYRLVSNEW